MESRALKVGWIAMLITGIHIVILGLAWILAKEAMSRPVFAPFRGNLAI